jgi:hypothetical protein
LALRERLDQTDFSHLRLEGHADGDQRGIAASYAWVEVKLQNHSAKGITDKDFELARKIEDFVSWRPGKEGGALEGTPSGDQRFAYIKYDDK